MSDQLPDPQLRVYFAPPRRFKFAGCAGCLIAIFVLGGILGVLLFGWQKLWASELRPCARRIPGHSVGANISIVRET